MLMLSLRSLFKKRPNLITDFLESFESYMHSHLFEPYTARLTKKKKKNSLYKLYMSFSPLSENLASKQVLR